MPGSRQVRLDSTLKAPSQARKTTVEFLFEQGCRTSIPLAELVVSELVTNAVVHAQGPIDMTLNLDGDLIRVEVADCSPERPLIRRIPSLDGGYGLPMIDTLSEAWGCIHQPDCKVVWADLSVAVATEW